MADAEATWDDYIMLSSSHEGYMKMTNTNTNSVEIIRCDIKDENGFCKYIIRDPTATTPEEQCVSTWTNASLGDWYSMDYYFRCEDTAFNYTEDPVPVDCSTFDPAATSDCLKYVNSETGKFIVLDGEGRMRLDAEGYNISFTNDNVPLSSFAVTDCDGTVIPAPTEDVCQVEKTKQPTLVPCAYHSLYHYPSEDWEDYAILSSAYEGYLYMKNLTSGSVEIIRCDIKDENGFCKYIIHDPTAPTPEEQCVTTWTNPEQGDWFDMDWYFRADDTAFPYNKGPVNDVPCPVGSANNCVKYINEQDGTYVILDGDGHIVVTAEGSVIEYDGAPVPLDVFAVTDCDGAQFAAPTVDVCQVEKPVQPALAPCAYHAHMNEWEDYIMLSNPEEGYLHMKNTLSNSVEIIRCDIKDENGFCKYIIKDPTAPPEEQCVSTWTNASLGDWFSMDYYFRCEDSLFRFNKGPAKVPCPVDANDCVMYVNEKENTYIILDEDGRMIVDAEGYTITYDDEAVTLDRFEVTDCDGTSYPAPTVDVCGIVKMVQPALVPCAYHAHMNDWEDYIMLSNPDEGYLYMKNLSSGSVEIIRCDIKDPETGFCKYIIRDPTAPAEEQCVTTWTNASMGDWFDMDYYFRCEDSAFSYIKGPASVLCPDGTEGCVEYVNHEMGEFIVLNGDNRMVVDAEGWTITYDNDAVPLDKFAVVDCDGTAYPAPTVDVCQKERVVEPQVAPCSYHVYLNEYEDYIMLSSSHEGYMRMVNRTSGSVEIIRCDIKNEDHYCKYITRGTDGLCTSEWTNPELGEYYDMDYLFRCEDSPFKYNKGPATVPCPVLPGRPAAQGCQQYVNEAEGQYIILDENMRTVVDYEGWLISFDDDKPTLDMFAVVDCPEYNNTEYPAPTEDVCAMKTHTLARTPCEFHSYCNEYEDWNMLANAETGSLRMYNRVDHTDEIIRCDIKNEDGYCLYITLDPEHHLFEEDCNLNWTNPAFGDWFNMDFMFHSFDAPFLYTKGPYTVICPEYDRPTGAVECQAYWNEEEDAYIVVSEKNVLIRSDQGFIMTYDDQEVKPIDFNVSFCNGTEIPLPEYVCVEQEIIPLDPGCSFHVHVDEYDDYIMLKSASEGYMYMKNTSSGAVEIIRCDVKDKHGYCLYITRLGDDCKEEWTDPYYGDWYDMDYLYTVMSSKFRYTIGPTPVECPVYGENQIANTGCNKFAYGDDYIILDKDKRMVRNVEGWIISYMTDSVPLSKFDLAYCNGTQLPPAKDVCGAPPKPQPSTSAASTVFSGVLLVAVALLLALF